MFYFCFFVEWKLVLWLLSQKGDCFYIEVPINTHTHSTLDALIGVLWCRKLTLFSFFFMFFIWLQATPLRFLQVYVSWLCVFGAFSVIILDWIIQDSRFLCCFCCPLNYTSYSFYSFQMWQGFGQRLDLYDVCDMGYEVGLILLLLELLMLKEFS